VLAQQVPLLTFVALWGAASSEVTCHNEATAENGVAVPIDHDELPISCDGGLDHEERGHHVLQ